MLLHLVLTKTSCLLFGENKNSIIFVAVSQWIGCNPTSSTYERSVSLYQRCETPIFNKEVLNQIIENSEKYDLSVG